MESSSVRGAPTALRGWLSDIYFPALLGPTATVPDPTLGEPTVAALARRLGGRAAIDNPVLGRAAGADAVSKQLCDFADWLARRDASFERTAFTTGIDRDVTEGVLSLAIGAERRALPVAVVAERRRSREVELRIYLATALLALDDVTVTPRAHAAAASSPPVIPPVISELIEALGKGDAAAALAAFELKGAAQDARGGRHLRSDGSLEKFFARFTRGPAWTRLGAADDGRACALEYERTRGDQSLSCLAVFERGESGLVRELRLYDDAHA